MAVTIRLLITEGLAIPWSTLLLKNVDAAAQHKAKQLTGIVTHCIDVTSPVCQTISNCRASWGPASRNGSQTLSLAIRKRIFSASTSSADSWDNCLIWLKVTPGCMNGNCTNTCFNLSLIRNFHMVLNRFLCFRLILIIWVISDKSLPKNGRKVTEMVYHPKRTWQLRKKLAPVQKSVSTSMAGK